MPLGGRKRSSYQKSFSTPGSTTYERRSHVLGKIFLHGIYAGYARNIADDQDGCIFVHGLPTGNEIKAIKIYETIVTFCVRKAMHIQDAPIA